MRRPGLAGLTILMIALQCAGCRDGKAPRGSYLAKQTDSVAMGGLALKKLKITLSGPCKLSIRLPGGSEDACYIWGDKRGRVDAVDIVLVAEQVSLDRTVGLLRWDIATGGRNLQGQSPPRDLASNAALSDVFAFLLDDGLYHEGNPVPLARLSDETYYLVVQPLSEQDRSQAGP